jgi:hypothetical protein
MLKNVNKADVFQSQCYSYGEHFTLYLIFSWICDDLIIFPVYTESRPLIWALSHYSTSCQTPTMLWQKFPLGNYIIGFLLTWICLSSGGVLVKTCIQKKNATEVIQFPWKPFRHIHDLIPQGKSFIFSHLIS